MNKAVIGIAQTLPQAEKIVSSLHSAGFRGEDISVLFPNKSGTKDFAHEHHTKAPEGAVGGASAGGVLGGTIGLLAGIGMLAIPGLGPFIAAGPIMAALSGVAAGATVGGITGALVGLGIPEIEAKVYEGKIKGGNLLIAVHSADAEMRKRADEIMKAGGAQDVSTIHEASVPKNPDARIRS
jgi:hypothetical protein